MTQETGEPGLNIAGFWRRIVAFVVDVLILGVVGVLAGTFLFDVFVHLGIYGRLLGFVVAFGYFGAFNSSLLGGQTPGKMVLGLRVVNAKGLSISLLQSFARYTVLGMPFFLNGLPLDLHSTGPWVIYPLSLIVFGLGLSIVYLYTFNRRTRQSLHDLAVGSYVVRIQPHEQRLPMLPVWKGHWVVVGLLAFASLALPVAANHQAQDQALADLLPAHESLSAQPHVIRASIAKNSVSMNGGKKSEYLVALLRLDSALTDDAVLAKDAARAMAKNYPAYTSANAVIVELAYGYDIGIATGWKSRRYAFKPEELK